MMGETYPTDEFARWCDCETEYDVVVEMFVRLNPPIPDPILRSTEAEKPYYQRFKDKKRKKS